MRTIALAFVILAASPLPCATLTGCGSAVASLAGLDSEVKSFLETNFAQEPLLRSVTVKSVAVVHVAGNQYRGVATVVTRRGEHQLPVSIVYSLDGGGLMEVAALDMAALRLRQM